MFSTRPSGMSSACRQEVHNIFAASVRFAGAIFGAAPRSHLTLGQIENPGAMSELRHFQQRAAAGLLYIVAVSSQGKDIEWGRRHVSRERIQIGWSG